VLNIQDLKGRFPPLPATKGTVAPIYYEPVALSGERYTVCVAAVMGEQVKVIQTIDKDTLICMFGNNAQSVQYFISEASQGISSWLSAEKSFQNYTSLVGNMYLGPAKTLNADNIDDILKIAIRNTASLASLNFIESEDDEIAEHSKVGSYTTRFIKLVKQEVLSSNIVAKNNFNKTIGKIHKYHFVGNHYVANLAAMNPATANRSIGEAKKSLWDLSVAKDYSFDLEQSELIMFLPANDEIQYSDKQYKNAKALLDFFEEEADKKQILLTVTSSAHNAAERLLKHIS
jgi:hypothetical protein